MRQGTTKNITMMDLRRHVGKVVNEIVYTNITYVVEKHGKPICRIQPYTTSTPAQISEQSKHTQRIERLFGSIKRKNTTESDDWTKEYDQVDQAYERRMQKNWT